MAEATNSKCGSSLCQLSQKFDKEAACTSRLCPSKSKLTEACFHETPVPFAGDSSLMLSNGTKIGLNSTFVVDGTLPKGSAWQVRRSMHQGCLLKPRNLVFYPFFTHFPPSFAHFQRLDARNPGSTARSPGENGKKSEKIVENRGN